MKTWPEALPRFAESFRILIDHPEWGKTRLLTGEWQSAGGWLRVEADFLPQLSKAGRIGIIASTAPRDMRDYSAKLWYGDADYPEIFWHPDDNGGLKRVTSDDAVAEYCRRRKLDRALFDKPIRPQNVPEAGSVIGGR